MRKTRWGGLAVLLAAVLLAAGVARVVDLACQAQMDWYAAHTNPGMD